MRLRTLAVGAGPEQVPAIIAALELGLEVHAVDGDAEAPGLALAPHRAVIDIADADAVIAYGRQASINLIIPAPIGRWLTTVAAVNAALDLPGLRPDAAAACVDKRLANGRLSLAGVAVARQVEIRSGADLILAAQELGLPAVLKPVFGSGSRGVSLILGPDQLPGLAAQMDQSADEAWILEQTLSGIEFGVDAALFADRFTPLMVREKIMTPPPARQEMTYLLPARISVDQQVAIIDTVERAARALGLEQCLINADVMLDPQGRAAIIEISGRAPGNNVSSRLFPAATGHNLIRLALQALIEARTLEPVPHRQPVVFSFLPFGPGRIAAIHTPDLAAVPGLLDWEIRAQPGERLGPLTTGAEAMARGWLMTTGPSSQAAFDLAQSLLQRMEVTYEPD